MIDFKVDDMRVKRNLRKVIAASMIAGSLMMAPNFCYFPFTAVAHAEVKTYEDVGEYPMPEDGTPSDAKSKAKMYAERNALEQAGVFVSSRTEVVNNVLTRDEIETFTAGILKIIDVQYEAIPLNDRNGYIKYRATVKATVDTDILTNAINQWMHLSPEERQKRVEQNNQQKKIIDELQKRIEELEKKTVNSNSEEEAKNSYDKANAYAAHNAWDKAVESYTKAIELGADPIVTEVYKWRGKAYYKLKEYNKAIEDYNKELEVNPSDGVAYRFRGFAYERLGEYEKAITDYNKSLQYFKSEYTYADLAYAYEKLGDKKMTKQWRGKAWIFKNYRETESNSVWKN